MITILGEHISIIRPCKIKKPIIPKECYLPKYNTRPKTNKENSGKVVAVCIMLASGGIRSMPVPATHFQVCEQMISNFNNVARTGWQLENGNYIWR